MIRLKKDNPDTIITDEELEWLAESYLKLQANKTYQKFSRTFKDFINEYLTEQLLAIEKLNKGDI